MTTQTITLTAEQERVKSYLLCWYFDKPDQQELKLGGYAGSGKTTLIKHLIHDLDLREDKDPPLSAVAAFTGKAVSVLRKKGVEATTLHSLMYTPRENKDHTITWVKRPYLGVDDEKLDIVIIDEASMISSELYKDLVSYKIKILWVGDPGQLEPVGDNPNLMRSPDVVLETIMRQVEGNPILSLATHVRKGGEPRTWIDKRLGANFDIVKLVDKSLVNQSYLLWADQILCAWNRTRIATNNKIRKFLDRTGQPLYVGEKLICLQNNTDFGVFNGLMGTVVEYSDRTVDLALDDGRVLRKLPLHMGCLQAQAWDKDRWGEQAKAKYATHWTYGYCITCHKAQGSEWDKVLVLDEGWSKLWDQKRWQYTAITRAAKELVYAI